VQVSDTENGLPILAIGSARAGAGSSFFTRTKTAIVFWIVKRREIAIFPALCTRRLMLALAKTVQQIGFANAASSRSVGTTASAHTGERSRSSAVDNRGKIHVSIAPRD
jgi:hypothetical protein